MNGEEKSAKITRIVKFCTSGTNVNLNLKNQISEPMGSRFGTQLTSNLLPNDKMRILFTLKVFKQ